MSDLRDKIAKEFWGAKIQLNNSIFKRKFFTLQLYPVVWNELDSEQRAYLLTRADRIIAIFQAFLPELPLLSEEDLAEISLGIKGLHYTGGLGYQEKLVSMGKKVVQAQRDKDQKTLQEYLQRGE